MRHFLPLLLMLCAGHALCDYPLQGDFLAKGKNHKQPLPGVPWFQCLLAHGLIHSGMVFLVTGSVILAILELVAHMATDYTKCEGLLSFNGDQFIHYLCKLMCAFMAANAVWTI